MPADKIVSPSFPQGRVQRAMPKPFARPSISLGGAGPVPRTWKSVRVTDIKRGDNIPGLGIVTDIKENMLFSSDRPWTIEIYGGEDNVKVYSGHESVYAFTADT